eukprot:XP_002260675.1 hypothetical protein, conserved in Plasmodium species [Plasmodium knowlesi strain H]
MIFSPFVLILLSLILPQWKCYFRKFEKDQGKYLSPPVFKVKKGSRVFSRLRRGGNRGAHTWGEEQSMSVCPLRRRNFSSISERSINRVCKRPRLNAPHCVRPFPRDCASICRSFDKRREYNTTQWKWYNKEKAQLMFILCKTGFNFPRRKGCNRRDSAPGGTINCNIDTRFGVHRKWMLLSGRIEKERPQDNFEQIKNDVKLPDGIPSVGEPCNGLDISRDSYSSEECTKRIIKNISQRRYIYNCTQNEDLFRILKGINTLINKLHVNDYGNENKGGDVLDVHSIYTDERHAKNGEEKIIDVHNMRRDTLSKDNYLNRSGDFSTTDKNHGSSKNTSLSSSLPDLFTKKAFKTWMMPLNLMLIKSWVENIIKSVCADDHADREISKNRNIFVKCENVIQKRLFFHLVCFYTQIATWTGERGRDVILYLYREDEEEAEKFYRHLKDIYPEGVISFFNYKNCIHNDKEAFIILLSYDEFFNLTLHVANKTPADLERYLNGKASCVSRCPNLFSLFSKLLICTPRDEAAKYGEAEQTFKIFLDDFNVTYNYDQSVIEKNLYENLFPAIDLRRDNVTFYPFLRNSLPTLWFKTWLEHVHKECYSVNLRKRKNVFILHKRFILPLLDESATAHLSRKGLDRRGPKEIAERTKAMINPSLYPLFDLATNKKRNFRTPQVERYMSIFNKHRKEIIVEYLKRHNLYNINKLKKKDKKIKRKFNIARRFLKKKKKNLLDLEISHYINFFMNKKKKGSIFFRKNVIDYGYVTEREFLHARDKIHILTKGVCSWHHEGREGLLHQQCGDASSAEKTRSHESSPRSEPHKSVKEMVSSEEVGRDNGQCTKWEEHEKCDEEMNAPFFLQSREATRLPFNMDTSLPNKAKHFCYKSGDKQGESCKSTARAATPFYPCIYYTFDKETFEKFSKELYAGLPFLPERFRQKWRNVLKKYEQAIRPSFSFKKYLLKGIFLVKEKLSKLEKQFIGELLKNNLIKIILSCVDISSDGISVNTVFVEDVQVYIKDKLPQYNQLLNLINRLHGDILHPRGRSSHLGNTSYWGEAPFVDDAYKLHFVKYFLYLNWAKVFRKYTLSNNDLLNLFANSSNCFLIPRRYEDISIFLNLQSESYLNLSHLYKTVLRDFYFNLYNKSISRGISFLLKNSDEWKINTLTMFDDRVSSPPAGGKSYRFFYTKERWDRKQMEDFFPHNIIYMAMKKAQNIHKIYKYKETNETILVDRFLSMPNETAYSINYFEFLYFFLLTNKNIGLIKRHLINNVFEFYAVKRKEYEKVFVTSDRKDKINDYLDRVERVRKYFPENYAYVYHDTFVKYNNIRKEVRKELRNMYRQKYSMLRETICEGDQRDLVLTTLDSEPCIILDIFKMKRSVGRRKEEQKNDLYVCANIRGDLFICNIFFFDRVLKDKKMCNFIKERNKGINYADHLFGQRDVVNYELILKERHFPFDIYLGDCSTGCADGMDNNSLPIEKKKKKNFHQFVVNKIKVNQELCSEKKYPNDREQKISQPQVEETKVVNLEDLFENWYSEDLYSRKRKLSLYWQKLNTLKREMLHQCAKRLKNDIGKNAPKECIEEVDHYNKVGWHPLQGKKNPMMYQVSSFCEGDRTSCMTRKRQCQSVANKIMSTKIMGTKIMGTKIMGILKKYKKRKNSGNRNNYTKEMNKVDRIFGNERKTMMDQFRNMYSFLQHFDLIDTLQKFLNPYVRNSLWFYVLTLYMNNQYEVDPPKFLVQPELLIIIFYISFCKGKGDYLENYFSSFQIESEVLRNVIVDVFQVYVEIPFNLEGVQDMYDGLIKLRERKFTEIDRVVKDKLHDLSIIVQKSISNNFNEGINQILFKFVRYVDDMGRMTQVM